MDYLNVNLCANSLYVTDSIGTFREDLHPWANWIEYVANAVDFQEASSMVVYKSRNLLELAKRIFWGIFQETSQKLQRTFILQMTDILVYTPDDGCSWKTLQVTFNADYTGIRKPDLF